MPNSPSNQSRQFRKTTQTRRAFLSQSLATLSAAATMGCRTGGALTLGCAAGWRTQVEPLISEWGQKQATRVRTTYDGSGRLVTSINAGMLLDVVLTADISYLDELPVSYSRFAPILIQRQTARLVTNSANKDRVTWQSVLDGKARLSMASPQAAAIGRLTYVTLSDATRNKLGEAVVVERSTVTEVAADVVALDVADAGIIWDTTWPNDDRLITVPSPELDEVAGSVSLLVSDTAPPAGKDLAAWLQRRLRPNS